MNKKKLDFINKGDATEQELEANSARTYKAIAIRFNRTEYNILDKLSYDLRLSKLAVMRKALKHYDDFINK